MDFSFLDFDLLSTFTYDGFISETTARDVGIDFHVSEFLRTACIGARVRQAEKLDS